MYLPLCTWTWIRVCACRCAYMSETHVDIVRRRTDVEGERSRTHEETRTLSAHHPPFFRSRLSNIWPQKGPSSVFHIERFFVHLLSPRTLGPVFCTQTQAGTEPQSVYFFRERFSCVYVFLCANSQRVAATLKTSIPLQ